MNQMRFANADATADSAPDGGVKQGLGLRCVRALVGEYLPTALVLAFLGGVAFWGHHHGWTLPRLEQLLGGAGESASDWCDTHGVPESICVECNDKLLPRAKITWCSRHGVHNCPFEYPENAQLLSVPVVSQADLERAEHALLLKERPENNKRCKKVERRLQLADESALTKMGIEVLPVWRDAIEEYVSAPGEITYQQPRVAAVATPVSGRIWHVTEHGQQGASVKQGDVLAVVDAAEVGKAKAEFLQAYAQRELHSQALMRVKAIADQGVIPPARLLEMQTSLQEAEIRLLGAQQALANLGLPLALEDVAKLSVEERARRLQVLGLPAALLQRLEGKTASANLYPIRALRDGTITTVHTVPGEVVGPGKPLFVIADTTHMWLTLHVRSEDVKYLRVRDIRKGHAGQVVKFRPDGGGEEVRGELVWRSTEVDPKTRTVQFRAEVPNPEGKLLAQTFGLGRVVLRREKDAIVVPNDALHWDGDCTIVFVRDKNFLSPGAWKIFHVRTVRPGVKTAHYTEIIAGLLPGEVVATTNSATLRAELLKSNLGAG